MFLCLTKIKTNYYRTNFFMIFLYYSHLTVTKLLCSLGWRWGFLERSEKVRHRKHNENVRKPLSAYVGDFHIANIVTTFIDWCFASTNKVDDDAKHYAWMLWGWFLPLLGTHFVAISRSSNRYQPFAEPLLALRRREFCYFLQKGEGTIFFPSCLYVFRLSSLT